MAKKKNIGLIFGLIIFALLIIGVAFFAVFQTYIPTIVPPTDGFIWLSDSQEAITSLSCSSSTIPSGTSFQANKECTSKYGTMKIEHHRQSASGDLLKDEAGRFKPTGDDTHILLMSGGGYSNFEDKIIYTSSMEIKNKRFRTTIIVQEGNNGIIDFDASIKGTEFIHNGGAGVYYIEFEPSFELDGTAEIFVNGNKAGDVILGNTDRFSVQINGQAPIRMDIYYQRIKDVFSCKLKEGENLFIETYQGGRSLSKEDLAYYDVAESHFCDEEFPVAVVSEAQEGATTTTKPYKDWIAGKIVTVPNDQVWAVYYIGNPTKAGLSTRCDAIKEMFNVNLNKCTSRGITMTCRTGVFDPILGTCVAESEITCIVKGEPLGYYDTEEKKCIYIPSNAVRCSADYPTYDEASDGCVKVLSGTDACQSGTDEERKEGDKLICINYEALNTKEICPKGVNGTVVASDSGQLICEFVTKEIVAVQEGTEYICPQGVSGTIKEINGRKVCVKNEILPVVSNNVLLWIVGILLVVGIGITIWFIKKKK